MSTPDYEEAIQLESQAYANVRRLAAELSDACIPIAGQGDGNCGVVLMCVFEALSARGLYMDPRTRPKATPKKQVIGHSLRTQVFERDAYRCKHCGTHKDLRADHVHPESKGGLATLENLQTLCAPCNSKKGARI